MGSFGGLTLTNRGRILQSKAQAGVTLQYTRIAIGDGTLGTTSILALNQLIHEVKSLNINKLKVLDQGRAVVGAVLTNQGLTYGFYFRELGVFAQDPDVGEILYCYGNSGDLADYIPSSGTDIVERNIDIQTVTGNAATVTAAIDETLAIETIKGAQEKANSAEANAKTYADAIIKDLSDSLGNLENLNTEQKNSLVVAINELLAEIGTLSTLSTTEKSNLVAAVNEIKAQVTEHLAEFEAQLSATPPVVAELVRGTQTLTASHDSNVKVKLLTGDTIVNLVPLFDSGLWTLHANVTVNSPSKITLNATAASQHSYILINVKANQDYTLSVTHNSYINVLDGTGNEVVYIGGWTAAQSITFNTGINTSIRIYLTNYTTATGTFTFEELSLNEGTTELQFVANVKGITNPTIENLTNGTVATLKGTFHEGDIVNLVDNQPMVTRAKREVELIKDISFIHVDNYTGFKRVKLVLPFNYPIPFVRKLVKYNGSIVLDGDTTTKADLHQGDAVNTNELIISIANTDSGWGQTYVPTADEFKAYFLGWRMYESNAVGGGTVIGKYNGTGVKQWSKIYAGQGTRLDLSAQGMEPIITGTITNTIPTVMNDQGYNPHRLIYDLATPITEVVEVVGSLTLDKGDNTLEVSEGRIVREVVRPYHFATDNRYYISRSTWSELEFKNSSILNIYKNGEIDTPNWTIYTTGVAYGTYASFIDASNFDTTAVYTVDYIPLEPYKVTAPTNPITIEYQSNLASVVEQTVDNIAQIQSDVADLQDSVVRKGEGVETITPTLLNGFTLYNSSLYVVGYHKDSLGYVHVELLLNNGTRTSGTDIFVLPKGFRPSKSIMRNIVAYSSVTDETVGRVIIINDGRVQLSSNTTRTYLYLCFIFKAEQ